MQKQRSIGQAMARITGSAAYPHLKGSVTFTQTRRGVLVRARICGLPQDEGPGVFAFHIHAGRNCHGNLQDPFADADGHYNPKGEEHPYHAGDLPPLFGNDGYAFMEVLTNRFTVEEILGRVVIIHENPDDFVTQPAGNAGNKIGCGKILKG